MILHSLIFHCVADGACGKPGIVPNSKREGDVFTVGSTITFTCNTGYTGGGTITCQNNTRWTTLPTCVGKNTTFIIQILLF